MSIEKGPQFYPGGEEPPQPESNIMDSRIQEKEHPEKNLMDSFNRLFYLLGKVVRENRGKLETERPVRTLYTRAKRAELYKQFKRTRNRENRQKIVQEAKERDQVLKEFLHQGDVGVSRPEIGNAKARFAVVNPPVEKEIKGEVPIVFIPGISNDLACVEQITQEAALSGRKIAVIGYPSSFMGEASPEFLASCKESQNFKSHATFFEDAIKKIVPDGNFELWGYSTGGPIVAEMLTDNKDFSERVTNAALIAPAGVVTQNKAEFLLGIAKDLRGLIPGAHKNVLTDIVTGKGRKEHVAPEASGQRKIKDEVSGILMDRIRRKSPCFDRMKVQEGGVITVVSYRGDDITKSRKLKVENPQVGEHIKLPGHHGAPLLHAPELVSRISAAQEKSDTEQ